MKINFIRAFEDNYIWTIEKENEVILIDPGEANPCFDYLKDKNLYAILLTHKHMDHVGGVKKLKEKFYGNRIVLFAPLYLSNYCVNGCLYCPYHAKNKTIPRRKLSQDEIRKEVIALQ
ncbi:MAG: MBL fold metallo-hydrolase, partial [Anaerococcus vaginalis]|nr:MBL fold metallo-hydrolase [Anaerococcus vaginalis]